MKKIIGYILLAAGAIHGIGVVVGLSKGKSALPLLGTAIIIAVGVFLVKSSKKNIN